MLLDRLTSRPVQTFITNQRKKAKARIKISSQQRQRDIKSYPESDFGSFNFWFSSIEVPEKVPENVDQVSGHRYGSRPTPSVVGNHQN